MREMDLLKLLLEDCCGRVEEEQLATFREMMPRFKGSELTGMDISMTLRTEDGKEYILDYNRDGTLQINLAVPLEGTETKEERAAMAARMEREEVADARLRKIILSILSDIKFSLRASGTTYLVDGIIMALTLKNESQRLGMTKEIYPYIAGIHGVSISSVERNIRLAIETAWSKMSCEYAMNHYPYEYTSRLGRPTNQEFVFALSGMIRRSYPEYAMWCRQRKPGD